MSDPDRSVERALCATVCLIDLTAVSSHSHDVLIAVLPETRDTFSVTTTP